MRIIVPIKQILDPSGMTVNRRAERIFINREEYIINPNDKNALEEALKLKGEQGAQVVAVTMGPKRADDALREAMAMGADSAFLLTDEAFEKARIENKPIFLSIGYSTCHWCHVMEKESFEDSEVARLMNEEFVSIKVDREERPDIDGIYMTVCQMMTQRGGWPLTIVMTPDKRPFFAGTYFPKNRRFQSPGMLELIPQLERAWAEKRMELEAYADGVIGELSKHQQPHDHEHPIRPGVA